MSLKNSAEGQCVKSVHVALSTSGIVKHKQELVVADETGSTTPGLVKMTLTNLKSMYCNLPA